MLQVVPSLSELRREQILVAANQVEGDTNQIEAARAQYASALNQFIDDAATAAAGLQKACASSNATQFAMQCSDAKSAIADFNAAIQHGKMAFTPYKRQVQVELDRQASMLQQMDN